MEYTATQPDDVRSEYKPFDDIVFRLQNPEKALAAGSLQLHFNAVYYYDGINPITSGVEAYLRPELGGHALIDTIQYEFTQGPLAGIVVTDSEYARKVACKHLYLPKERLSSETQYHVQGINSTETISNGVASGRTATEGWDYSLVLDGPLNSMFGLDEKGNRVPGMLKFDAVGEMIIKIKFNDGRRGMYARDVTSDADYTLTNLKLSYATYPSDLAPSTVVMELTSGQRQIIYSNVSEQSLQVPFGDADAFYAVFNKVSDESNINLDYYKCMSVPGIPQDGTTTVDSNGFEAIKYQLNDGVNSLTDFVIEGRDEIEYNSARVLNQDPYYSIYGVDQYKRRNARDGYMIGIPFGAPLDFSKNRFNIQLQSQIGSEGENYVMYYFFRTIRTLSQ